MSSLTAPRFTSRGPCENIHVARLRVRAALDVRMSGNAFVQYNSASHTLAALPLVIRDRDVFAHLRVLTA